MVRCLGDQMGFWSGGQKRDADRSTRRVRGQGMCVLGVMVVGGELIKPNVFFKMPILFLLEPFDVVYS